MNCQSTAKLYNKTLDLVNDKKVENQEGFLFFSLSTSNFNIWAFFFILFM